MMNKRKACPTVSAAEQAKQEKHWTNGDSYNDSITETGKKQAFPVALKLKRGEKNAISSRKLVILSGFRSERDLQAEIAKERAAGALILSACRNGGGYFLPSRGEEGQREIAAFVATLSARALNTLRAIKPARSVLRIVNGQIGFDEIESALVSMCAPEIIQSEKTKKDEEAQTMDILEIKKHEQAEKDVPEKGV